MYWCCLLAIRSALVSPESVDGRHRGLLHRVIARDREIEFEVHHGQLMIDMAGSLSHDRYQRARSHVYIRWLHALVGTIAEVLAIPDVVLAAFGIDERCIDLIGLLARRSLALTGREFVCHCACVCIKRLVFV